MGARRVTGKEMGPGLSAGTGSGVWVIGAGSYLCSSTACAREGIDSGRDCCKGATGCGWPWGCCGLQKVATMGRTGS